MDGAEAVAKISEIRRSAIYRVGVWFTRLLFSAFGLVTALILLAVVTFARLGLRNSRGRS